MRCSYCPVQAKGFAWCQVNGDKYQAYLSAIVEIDDGPDAFRNLVNGPFGKGFQDYVRTSLDPKASTVDCNRQDSLFFAQDYIDVQINANPGYKFVKTGWRVKPATSTASQSKRGNGNGRVEKLQFRK